MRRALVLFGNEIERGSLAESAAFLEKELGFKIYPLYVKDIAREKLTSHDGSFSILVHSSLF